MAIPTEEKGVGRVILFPFADNGLELGPILHGVLDQFVDALLELGIGRRWCRGWFVILPVKGGWDEAVGQTRGIVVGAEGGNYTAAAAAAAVAVADCKPWEDRNRGEVDPCGKSEEKIGVC
ncbi:beta-galactosidase 3 [Striga asiatica]|uniref:Beta-galactosidase 3 n=1 Tax=Striga asiatica TaxID=4170 RepID=A0A5A7PN51_STRAF|nr:beta-galactosidase 3 [Striga asiatica]